MQTTIHKKFEVKEPIDKVWAYLTDPTKIVTCVPGATLEGQVDADTYKGKVSLKFGPVKAKFNGEVHFEERDVENRKMTLKGKGLDAKGKGSADMLMNAQIGETANGTEVDCSMQITIIGKLAQFGARLINDVTDQLFDQFVSNFKNKLAEDSSFAVASIQPQGDTAIDEIIEDVKESLEGVTEQVEDAVEQVLDAVKEAVVETAPPITPTNANDKTPNKTPNKAPDNSINVVSLIWAIIKGFFARLFGGKK